MDMIYLILKLNLTSNLMIKDTKESVIKGISWIIISNLRSILETYHLSSKNIKSYAIKMSFSTESCVSTVLIDIFRTINKNTWNRRMMASLL